MQFTIDTTSAANVTLVLMYAPQTFSECLIHAMDAYRAAVDAANNRDLEKAARNLAYAENKVKFAVKLASECQSKRKGAKRAIAEAEEIEVLCDRLRFTMQELAA